jgi:hypothetical protein
MEEKRESQTFRGHKKQANSLALSNKNLTMKSEADQRTLEFKKLNGETTHRDSEA